MTKVDERKVQALVERHVAKLVGSLENSSLLCTWDTPLYESLMTAAIMSHIHTMEDMDAWHRNNSTKF